MPCPLEYMDMPLDVSATAISEQKSRKYVKQSLQLMSRNYQSSKV